MIIGGDKGELVDVMFGLVGGGLYEWVSRLCKRVLIDQRRKPQNTQNDWEESKTKPVWSNDVKSTKAREVEASFHWI
jgi:hypothetical protein